MTLDPRKMTKEERRCASTYEDQLRIAEEIYSDPTLNIKSSSMGTRFEGLSEILIKNYTSDTIRALTKYGIFIIDKLAYFADEANKENLKIIIWTVIGLIGSKILSGWLAMRLAGFSNKKGILAGLMTVPQLSATLAAATVGLSLNIIPPNFFNAIIVLSIITTIPIPILVKIMIVKMKIKFDTIEDKLSSQEEIFDDELY